MEQFKNLIDNQNKWGEIYREQRYDTYITKNRAEKARAKEKAHLEREKLKPTNKCRQDVAYKIHLLNQRFF
jgi:hypothetical protein